MQLTPEVIELDTELEEYENTDKTYKIDFSKKELQIQ